MESANSTDTAATQAAIAVPMEVPAERPESASSTLTGRMVLASWIVSIFVHFMMFVVMLIAVFPFADESEPPPVSVAQTRIVGSIERAPIPPMPKQPGRTVKIPEVQAPRVVPQPVVPLAELTQTRKPTMSIVGVGAGGGDFKSLGLSVGGGAPSDFFGVGSSSRGARNIVYVVDRSGSMTDTFVHVKEEMKRSVEALRRSQKFHVIFFSTGQPIEKTPRTLVSAVPAYKRAFYSFLDGVEAAGGTNPLPALRRAFALDPDVIYLLSDGHEFPRGFFARLDEWNPSRNVAVHTIAYLDPEGGMVLERVAREHNGEFRYVSDDDLP